MTTSIILFLSYPQMSKVVWFFIYLFIYFLANSNVGNLHCISERSVINFPKCVFVTEAYSASYLYSYLFSQESFFKWRIYIFGFEATKELWQM